MNAPHAAHTNPAALRHRREAVLGYAFALPALAVLGVFGIYPLVYAVGLSLFEQHSGAWTFAGLGHYDTAFHSPEFWNTVRVTLYYALVTVPITLALSLAVAIALFRVPRFAGFLRTAYFLPYTTSVVAAAMVWRVMFAPREGVANLVLGYLGLPEQTWLLEPRGVLHLLTNGAIPADVGPSLALVCVMLFEIWRSLGFMIVLILAGLANIPHELEDAARIDGASGWRLTRHITVPLLSPTLFFLAVVGVIQALQAFSNIYAMTGDGRGPLNTTQNLTVYIFTNFYELGRLEYGAAIAVLLALGIMVLTWLQWRVLRPRVHYE